MAGLNSRWAKTMAAPFLTYLTVFKSRLGALNLVLQLSGLVHQPEAALLRRLRSMLEETEALSLIDPNNGSVFEYLLQKGLVGREVRAKGRYAQYAALTKTNNEWRAENRRGEPVSALETFVTDVWLSNPAVRSTIGVPTPENAGETLELAHQLRVLLKSKNTWTAAGQLSSALRDRWGALIADAANPFLLGVESVAFLRQVVATDGLLMMELVRELTVEPLNSVTRDEIAGRFSEIVARAVDRAKALNAPQPSIHEARDFLKLIRETGRRRTRSPGKRTRPGGSTEGPTGSRGPGVLEHRVSPRLEWLTDLGYLSKEGLPKNGFTYVTTSALQGLLSDLEASAGEHDWAEQVAVSQWNRNPYWSGFKVKVSVATREVSFREAYRLMQRRIGPSPLREVAIVSALMASEPRSFRDTVADLITYARETEGATLSGGQFRRTPENIYLPDTGAST
jgi:hypothetical protein